MIQLKLDHAALQALFPPDSEVRLELQKAVIAQFTKSVFWKFIPSAVIDQIKNEAATMESVVKAAIDEAKVQIAQEAAAEHGLVELKKERFSSAVTATLSDSVKRQIALTTEHQFSMLIDEAIRDAAQKRVDGLAAVGSRFDAFIDGKIKAHLEDVIIDKVHAALGNVR